jgi:DNA-binding transcriptional MerR regulator
MTTTTAAGPLASIGEVSERTGLSTHTLRFYEKEGLFIEPVRRDTAGRRLFSEQEIGWLRVCCKLRSTGMPLPDIRRYAELVRAGAGTVEERFRILRGHEDRVRAQLADLQDVLATIEAKVAHYASRLAEGTADQLWLGGPECAPPAPGQHGE